MSSSEATNLVVGVVVVGLLVWRQMQTRPVRENSAARIVGVLGVIGVIEIADAVRGHAVGSTAWAWIIASLVVGAVLGAVRAFTVKVWRLPDGSALRKGTALTAALWIVSLGAHLAMEAGIDHATKVAGLGAASLLLYVAVTLGAQREVLRRRACVLVAS